MAARGLTLAQVRKLPATTDVATAARALGFGRSTSYEAIRTGEFPVKTISVRGRVRVLTADLIRVLEGGGSDAPAAG
jgi:Helix-turn-helix domain